MNTETEIKAAISPTSYLGPKTKREICLVTVSTRWTARLEEDGRDASLWLRYYCRRRCCDCVWYERAEKVVNGRKGHVVPLRKKEIARKCERRKESRDEREEGTKELDRR